MLARQQGGYPLSSRRPVTSSLATGAVAPVAGAKSMNIPRSSFPALVSSTPTSNLSPQKLSSSPPAAANGVRSFSATSGKLFKASEYKPDSSDEVDVDFAEALKEMSSEAAARMRILRKGKGRYEIDGRPVQVFQSEEVEEDDEDSGLAVTEEGTGGAVTPLGTYLNQAAHVAYFTAVHSSPQRKKQTFGDARIPDDTDPFTARLMCMRLACEQAEKRQSPFYKGASFPAQEEGTSSPVKKTQAQRSWWERLTRSDEDSGSESAEA